MELYVFMYVIAAVLLIFLCSIIYLVIRRRVAEQKILIAEETAKKVLDDAKKEAETVRREAILEAKSESLKMKADFDRETKERKNELLQIERRLMQREDNLEAKEKGLETTGKELKEEREKIEQIKIVLEKIRVEVLDELKKISNLSTEEAKRLLLAKIEKDCEREAAEIIKNSMEKSKKDSEKIALEMITAAIQRCAVENVVETTTTVVALPSDDMKGRIIGREGRNIRAFETFTGVDLIVDDTPEAVILSSFDPVRRETARLTLEKLIVDGRIHPARVEEMYRKSTEELKVSIWEHGEKAALEAEVHNLPPVLIQLLGRLRYRTSFGQNVLSNCVEAAKIAGMIASELGVNVKLAKRAALLHDIGKAIDQEVEGTHARLGATFAQKAGESPEVVHCILAHHGEEEPKTVEAILVVVGDAISASRPGARRDTLEAYVKRLENLEKVAKSFEGVEKAFAIQAGREVRILVQPQKVDDLMATKLAHDVARKIEAELDYPGEVKVTVVREVRASDVAK